MRLDHLLLGIKESHIIRDHKISLYTHFIKQTRYIFVQFIVGGIAQLVERCFCTADVSGSNPLISKNRKIL